MPEQLSPEPPLPPPRDETSLSPRLAVGVIAVLVLIIGIVYFVFDYLKSKSREITCDDGIRYTIDIRDFATENAKYSVALDAHLKETGDVSAKIDRQQSQQLSDDILKSNEFRKFIVAGYNGCAISKADYKTFEVRAQQLDQLAGRIDVLLKREKLSAGDQTDLNTLINEYTKLLSGVPK